MRATPKHDMLRRFTALGRPLEPDWPTNRAVMILAPVGAALAALFALLTTEAASPAALGAAAAAGAAAIFLGWALGRELAPDHQGAAFVSMATTFAATLLVPQGSLFVLVVALVLARLVNRTVGLLATPLDIGAAVGLSMALAALTATPSVAAVGALAFLLDRTLHKPHTGHGVAAVTLVVFAGVLLAAQWGGVSWLPEGVGFGGPGSLGSGSLGAPGGSAFEGPGGPNGAASPISALAAPGVIRALVGGIMVAFGWFTLQTRTVASVCDVRGIPLHPSRVRGGRWVALLLALSLGTSGMAGLLYGSLLWAALGGVALWQLGARARPRPR